MLNTIFNTKLIKGGKGDRGREYINNSIPTGGIIAYNGADIPTGYAETTDPTGQGVSNDIVIGAATYTDIPSDFFDVLNITENTTPQDVATFLNMSLRQGSQNKYELYKDSTDYYTRYVINTLDATGISIEFYYASSVANVISGTTLYAYKGTNFTIWGASPTQIYYGWAEATDQNDYTKYIYFSTSGSVIYLSNRGNYKSIANTKIYEWNTTYNVFRKVYIIDTNNYIITKNGYMTEVYKQNLTDGFIVTINGEQYITINKLANYAGLAFKL